MSTHADDALQLLAEVVRGVNASDLPSEVEHEVKRRLLDTLGLAIGGYGELPTRGVRRYALNSVGEGVGGATIWGTRQRTVPEIAALANCTAMHSQDFMDTYLSPSGEACHPADIIPGVLALAEQLGSASADVIQAIAVAYEVACRLCDAAEIRSRGWDHVTYMGIAAACACASLLGLEDQALSSAISLAAIPSVALRQTRNGEISMWKACAPGTAIQHGVRSAMLADAGLRGPTEPFVGTNGFERRVSGPLDRAALQRSPGDAFGIMRTHIKYFPTQYHTQAGIEAALEINKQLLDRIADDPLTSVEVTTSSVCRDLTADSPNKWDPTTRETADHSMPYLVVAALRNGEVSSADFEQHAFRDAARLSDMAKVTMSIDAQMDADYPHKLSVRVDVTQASGTRHSHQVNHPLGHAQRPMSDAQVEAKFRTLTSPRLGQAQADRIADQVWHLETTRSIGDLVLPVWVSQQ